MYKNIDSDYYVIPTYPHTQSKVITVFGIMMFVAVMIGVIYICPWKPSEGLVSIDYSPVLVAEEDQIISPDESIIDAKLLENLFETGTLQSGGYVQKKTDEEYHLYYKNVITNCYQTGEFDDGLEFSTKISGLKNTGLCLGNHFVSVSDDQQIIYQNLDTLVRNEFEFDWKETITNDEEYDYCKITRLLSSKAEKLLSIREVAAIAGLIQENILIGYQNGEAWFFVPEDNGLMKLVCSNSDSWGVAIDKLDKPNIYAMVADGTYLILDYKDKLGVIHIDNIRGYYYPTKTENGEEPVLGFSYSIRDNVVTIYQYGETTMQWLSFRDHEEKASDIQSHNYRNDGEELPTAMGITMSDEIDIIWHQLKKDYHWYKFEGAK